MRKKRHPDVEPDPEQLALMPDVSGNDINGLGETEPRRPTRIYWRNPAAIPHCGANAPSIHPMLQVMSCPQHIGDLILP